MSYLAFDHLATMVAVIGPGGQCVFANAAFESVLMLPRSAVERRPVDAWFVEPQALRETLEAVARNDFATSRLELQLRLPPGSPAGETLDVLAIVNQMEGTNTLLLELLDTAAQVRQEREERALGQAAANKELVRNLAHEIKNPLGGIRGAAQLLAMEIESRELTEYTNVIIQEADRLQALVDRLLAPHRKPHLVSDVNVHEVCERVRSLVLAEFPRGLAVDRDYDISIPDFRGDREQLIQAVLNITQNAAQALHERIASGTARIALRTRIVRQMTIGKRRWRLALDLHIQDNGPGIPEQIRDRIFHPLVSGRDGGSGLGLTLAQTFVQQHHGTIECESEPGRTVFRIVIPLP